MGHGGIGLALSLLTLGFCSPTWAQSPAVTLTTQDATIPIPADAPQADGIIQVTFTGLTAADVTLRAVPLAKGDGHGFVHFPDSGGRDTVALNAGKLNCTVGKSCAVHYFVTEMWPPGLYQGTIEAWGPAGKLASASIAVMRLPSSFHPILTSDRIHDGRISVAVEGSTPTTFLLAIQNPTGSPPHHFALAVCLRASIDGCTSTNTSTPSNAVNFLPASFWLESGATQTVSVAVQPCSTGTLCSENMIINDEEQHDTPVQTVISVTNYDAIYWRQAWLFGAVLFGSIVSVLLNNLFPATRAKQVVREDFRRIEGTLRDCSDAGAALLDALNSEVTRLKLVVHQISFAASTKDADLQNARQEIAALATTTALARRLSLLRIDADGAVLSITVHALLRGKLRDAEEALRASDRDSATSRLNEAQAKLTEARNDGEQAELRRTLQTSITKLMEERGIRPAPAKDAPVDVKLPQLAQPEDRDPLIRELIAQLNDDSTDYLQLNTTDLLDAERDFYVADVWTEYMERKLHEFDTDPPADDADADAWETRKKDWIAFSRILLQCLRRNPNSDQTQIMLDLLRNDTTLQDIASSLRDGAAQIECDMQPKYLEAVDIALALTDPLLQDVSAVRRIINYKWSFGDGTNLPPNVDRCRHYFRSPARARARAWSSGAASKSYDVSVKVSVPFTDAQNIDFTRKVTPRVSRTISVTRWTGWINFLVTAGIAVVTAFGAKYATSVPNVVGWPDCLTAFMLGFGLDQLRDTIASPLSAALPAVSVDSAPAAAIPRPNGGAMHG